jgi:cobalt/nickel transport system permease protein
VIKKTSGFLEKSIIAIIGFIRTAMESDAIAARSGFLQACDVRFKFISIALLLCSAIATKSVALLAILYLISIILALVSSIPLMAYLKRTLLFIPLFSFFIAIPALFSVVTPGEPVVSVHLRLIDLVITKQGIDSAVIFFLRVLASVSLAILLMLTTRHHTLLKTLRIFKVPQIFVMTMGMTYRYIFLLLDIISNTFTAIKSRAGFVTSTKTGRRVVALNMAGIWLKSYRMHSQVYEAMMSRGFCGEPVIAESSRARFRDYLMLIVALFLLTGTLWVNNSFR